MRRSGRVRCRGGFPRRVPHDTAVTLAGWMTLSQDEALHPGRPAGDRLRSPMFLSSSLTRWLGRGAAALLLFVPLALAAPAPGVQGEILDLAGQPLAGVRVLLGRAGGDVFGVDTATDGSFSFPPLDPGRYLLVASKAGYQTSLRHIDAIAGGGLDLTLRLLGDTLPPGAGPPPPPPDAAWMLRLPARDVLREMQPVEMVASGPSAVAGAPEGVAPVAPIPGPAGVGGAVEQWFSLALGGPTGEAAPLEDGRSTGVRLEGRHGDAVSWSVLGHTGRESAAFEGQPLTTLQDQSHQVQVSVNVAADRHNEFDVSAYFDQNDRNFDVAEEEDAASLAQRSRAWGYAAQWSGQVRGSDLDVQVGYGAANLEPAHGAAPGDSSVVPLEDQRWQALGAIAFSPGERHRLRLGMRAGVYQFDSADLRLTLGPGWSEAGPVGLGQRGWSVNLFGRESYEISAPVALDFGFDFHHLGFDEPVSFLLPQAGVTYRPGEGQSLRALVMMKLDDRHGSVAEAGGSVSAAGDAPVRQVGYLLSWNGEFGGRLSLSVSGTVRPYAQERFVDDLDMAFDPIAGRSLFVSDGDASSREVALRLEKRFTAVEHSTGVRVGTIEGSLISYLPNDIPSQVMGYNEVRFVAGNLQTRFLRSGTRVRLDYQRVDNGNLHLGEGESAPLTYSELDVVVEQKIFSPPGRGDWRLLIGYEEILNTSSSEGASLELARLGVADQLRRVNGGVSINF